MPVAIRHASELPGCYCVPSEGRGYTPNPDSSYMHLSAPLLRGWLPLGQPSNKYLAGVKRFELLLLGPEPSALTAWRHPSIFHFLCKKQRRRIISFTSKYTIIMLIRIPSVIGHMKASRRETIRPRAMLILSSSSVLEKSTSSFHPLPRATRRPIQKNRMLQTIIPTICTTPQRDGIYSS